MIDYHFTRREVLAACASTLASSGLLAREKPIEIAPPPRKLVSVDNHVHLVDSRLPGGLDVSVPLAPFAKDDKEGAKKLAQTFDAEAKASSLTHALGMPRCQISDADPLGIRDTLSMASLLSEVKLHPVGLAHPERFDRDHLEKVEAELKKGKVKALKAYLGYLHYEPTSPGYRFYFKLAAKYNIPVIFHCGDTYSKTAKLKYTHPLKVDELAADYPKTKFVIAHFGNPWLLDAAAVAYKNDNVWIDLSALLIFDAENYQKKQKNGTIKRELERISHAIDYVEDASKFLFGSDWPLCTIPAYQDFVAQMFSPSDHSAVFGETAKKLFQL